MRSFKTSVLVLIFVISTIVMLGSCQDHPTILSSPVKSEDPSVSQLQSDRKLASKGDTQNVFEKFLEQKRKIGKIVVDSKKFDFIKESRVDIPGSEIKILVVEKIGNSINRNTSIFGFQKKDMIAPYFVINEIYNVGKNHFRVDIKTVSGELFFTYQVKEKYVFGFKLVNNSVLEELAPHKLSKISPGSSEIEKDAFSACVKSWIDYMGGGTIQGSVTFVFCVAFGPECAAMIVGNCLGEQVASWFGWI